MESNISNRHSTESESKKSHQVGGWEDRQKHCLWLKAEYGGK
jgi:hypothetical protein